MKSSSKFFEIFTRRTLEFSGVLFYYVDMKNVFILMAVLLFSAGSIVAVENVKYNKLFTTRMSLCLTYAGSFTTEDGTKISNKIISWKEHKCRYWESNVDKDGEKTTYMCNFDRPAITLISAAMKADPTGKDSADDVWKSYKENEAYCKKEVFNKK